VVLTGGSTGIGKEAVQLFHQNGAKVIFGDVADQLGQALESSLNSPNAKFQHCDTTSYQDQLALFQKALDLYGKVDIVVANAGISLPQDPFLSDQDVTKEPSTKELDVNLKGCIFTARIGLHYLRQNGGGELVMVSSIAGFKESTGLGIYTASKHGVIGLMRGQRIAAQREGCRINVVSPWMTKTGMVKGIEEGWRQRSLPENQPVDVATSILICATANGGAKKDFWGKIVYAAGGQSYEIEDTLWELEPVWLGKENSRVLALGQAFLMDPNTSWDPTKKSRV